MLLGINALNHDASVCLVDGNEIKFAAHAERYSRVKNDSYLNNDIITDCLNYGSIDTILWFEKPIYKALRRIYSWQRPFFQSPYKYLRSLGLEQPIITVPHHAAHAAMGYYTSGYEDASILVIDAIGEWNTVTVWEGIGNKLRKIKSINYPNSMGLFYSAATHAIGLKPNEEEYILMGMAAYGVSKHTDQLRDLFFSKWDPPYIHMPHNLHRGMRPWLNFKFNPEDFAASVQALFTEYLAETVESMASALASRNLVLSGGSALNCVANGLLNEISTYGNIWVPPNPGDSGLALGAIAYHLQQPLNFNHAYLGYDINRDIDPKQVVEGLLQDQIVGVANGRAEWGPRALGNRSLLADPRGTDIKDRVNQIKKRQKFRPFAPAILSEHAEKYFEISKNNHNFMQYAVVCKDPHSYPAIVHVDFSSRVQTVPQDSPSILRKILECWYKQTGCPMLLNTSLNIKGEPLVNNWTDALNFGQRYNVRVY